MSNQYGDKNLKIFSLNSNPELAKEIADIVGVQLGKCSVTRFSDGKSKLISKKVFADVTVISSSLQVTPLTSILWNC